MDVYQRFHTWTINLRAAFWICIKTIANRPWNAAINVRHWLDRFFFNIFYLKPLELGRARGLEYPHLHAFYQYVKIIGLILWVCPLASFFVYYLVITQGCTSATTRGFLEDFCIGPYLSPQNEMPWYLDLWASHGNASNHSVVPIPIKIERIMTGDLRLRDAAMALDQQISKLEHMAPDFTTPEVFSSLIQIQVTVMEFIPYYENFSRSFCQEKDIMNHALRTFVNAYARAISRAPSIELSMASILTCPLWHALRFINHFALIPWLPEPRLYSLQVRAELRFHAKRFVRDSLAALARIDASFSTMRRSGKSDSFLKLIRGGMSEIDLYQQKLEQTIDDWKKNETMFQPFLSLILTEREETQALKEHYARGDRMRRRLFEMIETILIYKENTEKIESDLHTLRTSFSYDASFQTSPQGSVAVPAPLQAVLLRLPVFSQLGPNLYHYNLNVVDDVDLLSLRSTIAQLCKERTNDNMVSGSLYMACNFWHYAMTISELDDDLLQAVQRSWVLQRVELRRRHWDRIGAEHDNVLLRASSIIEDLMRGTPLPEYLH